MSRDIDIADFLVGGRQISSKGIVNGRDGNRPTEAIRLIESATQSATVWYQFDRIWMLVKPD